MASIQSWGANSHGQLGQDTIIDECYEPSEVKPSSWTDIETIAVGGGHSVLLDKNGKLFACGWNNHTQLASDDKNSRLFKRVWSLSGILFKDVSCGWDGTCAISNEGHLYVWGSNSYGQLGLPRDHFPKNSRPIQLELRVNSISMGMRHTAVVDLNGNVWITGLGKLGQLGLGPDVKLMDRFIKISELNPISLLACGQHHTVAYSSQDHILYAWGDNRFGQLLSDNVTRVFSPIKVNMEKFDAKITQLKSGWTHNAALLESGRVFLWGRNNYGQLGCPIAEVSFNVLTIPSNEQISQIALGSEHSLSLTVGHSVYSWGWNEHGNTGTEVLEEVIWEPLKLKFRNDEKVHRIFAGSGHNFAVIAKTD